MTCFSRILDCQFQSLSLLDNKTASVQMAYKIEEVKIENRDTVQMENVISVSHILKKIFYKHLGIEQCLAEIESVDKVLRSLEGHSFFH